MDFLIELPFLLSFGSYEKSIYFAIVRCFLFWRDNQRWKRKETSRILLIFALSKMEATYRKFKIIIFDSILNFWTFTTEHAACMSVEYVPFDTKLNCEWWNEVYIQVVWCKIWKQFICKNILTEKPYANTCYLLLLLVISAYKLSFTWHFLVTSCSYLLKWIFIRKCQRENIEWKAISSL